MFLVAVILDSSVDCSFVEVRVTPAELAGVDKWTPAYGQGSVAGGVIVDGFGVG